MLDYHLDYAPNALIFVDAVSGEEITRFTYDQPIWWIGVIIGACQQATSVDQAKAIMCLTWRQRQAAPCN